MRCPSCRANAVPGALACPACGRLLVAPDRVVEGTITPSSTDTSGASPGEPTTVPLDALYARRNRLTRQRSGPTLIGSLARFAQDAWNEPVVRMAAGAALLALGERLADRVRRESARGQDAPARRSHSAAGSRNANGDRSLVPYTHPGEIAEDRGYVGGVIETLIIVRRSLRRR
jgi:hypothetical protein